MTAPTTRMPEPARGALKGLLLERLASAPPARGGGGPGRLLVAACGAAAVIAAVVTAVSGSGGSATAVAVDCYTAPVAPGSVPAGSVRVVSLPVASADGPADVVAAALADCARLWRTGRLDATAGDAGAVPRLVACRAPHHHLAVYPGGDTTCRQLGLESA